MSIKQFIADHISRELIDREVDHEIADSLGLEAAQHWGEMSHCEGPIFKFLLNEAVKKAEQIKNEK